MRITSKNSTGYDIERAIKAVSAEHYKGNITIDMNAISRNGYRVKLGVTDSRGPGARQSSSGRHGPWLCWHGFREAIAAIFLVDQDATVHTGYTTYKGAADFLDRFPRTASHNVGSLYSPAYASDMCHDVDGNTCDYAIHSEVTEKLAEAVEMRSVRTIGEAVSA